MDNSYEVPELVSVNNKRFNWYTKEFEDITDDSPIGIAYLGETDNYRYNDKYDNSANWYMPDVKYSVSTTTHQGAIRTALHRAGKEVK